MNNEVKVIPMAAIKPSDVALRTVDKESEAYLGLVDSIRERGVQNSIAVAARKDEQGQEYYVLVDGLHRYTAAMDVGLEVIPATILQATDDAAVLESQIVGNLHRVETKGTEYSKGLRRLFLNNPLLTMSELAAKLSKSPSWLADRLSLVKLIPEAALKVDEDTVSLVNAYALAKLPADEQANFLDRAMTMEAGEFNGIVNERVRAINKANREGNNAEAETFVAVPRQRKLTEIKEAGVSPDFAINFVSIEGISDPVSAVKATLNWVLHLDKATVASDKAKFEQRIAERNEARQKRDQERLAKKAAAAKLAAEQAQAALEGKPAPSEG
jgi:ParB/RepB/Spo0J family partition protein